MGEFVKERVRAGDYFVDVRRSLPRNAQRSVLMIHGIGVSGRYLMPFANVGRKV